MNVILRSVMWQHATVYIDETIFLSKTSENHFKHIEESLQLLENADISIQHTKCFIFSDTIH